MKLSKIKYRDIILKYNFDNLEKIVFKARNNQIKEKCDIGIVFGSPTLFTYRIDSAIRLYNQGLINKILVTGGIGYLNVDRKTSEAFKMKKYLIRNNIPEKDILVESNSRNTNENVKFSLDLLRKYNMDRKKLLLITSDFHLKRCLSFMSQQHNKKYTYGYGIKDGKTDIDTWKKSLYSKIIIIKEAILLCYYARRNKIANLNIKGLKSKKDKDSTL